MSKVPLFIIDKKVTGTTTTYYAYCTDKDCNFLAKANIVTNSVVKHLQEHDFKKNVVYLPLILQAKSVRVEILDCAISIPFKHLRKLQKMLAAKIRRLVEKNAISPTIDRVNEFLDNIEGQCEDRLMETLSPDANDILGIVGFIRERINPK